MAKTIAEATGAARAEVWLRVGDELRPAASWPDADDVHAPIDVAELDHIPGNRTFPVTHRDELLGVLSVTMSPSEPLTPSQDKLLRDLASQAGLVLRNVRLVEEVRASRQRLVAAQDERAKALERNLHDGAQQQLVALVVKLRLARAAAEKEGAGSTASSTAWLGRRTTPLRTSVIWHVGSIRPCSPRRGWRRSRPKPAAGRPRWSSTRTSSAATRRRSSRPRTSASWRG